MTSEVPQMQAVPHCKWAEVREKVCSASTQPRQGYLAHGHRKVCRQKNQGDFPRTLAHVVEPGLQS